jgi:hypothetical protein
MKTAWSADRLKRLLARYNRQFWADRVRGFTISAKELGGPLGLCDPKSREILIDVAAHPSDREIRATVLHEMAHAASGRWIRIAHGYRFWEQIEMLLAKRAPILVTNAEAPQAEVLVNVIPKRFPLSRKAVERLERIRVRAMDKLRFDGSEEITEEVIVGRFEEAAMELYDKPDLPWNDVRALVGFEYSLLDVGGRPKNAWAARVIANGQKAYVAKRRYWLRVVKMEQRLGNRQ